MLFNSPEFLLSYRSLSTALVRRAAKFEGKNVLLLVASASSTVAGLRFWAGCLLVSCRLLRRHCVAEASEKRIKKRWMAVSLLVNLGLLAYFKYANFFIESWSMQMASICTPCHCRSSSYSISFYTFQNLIY